MSQARLARFFTQRWGSAGVPMSLSGAVHEKEGRVIKTANVGRSSSDRRPSQPSKLQVISVSNDLLKGKAHG